MPINNKAFTGKLNLDVQAYRLPEGDYIDALNITRVGEGEGTDTVISNADGNIFVAYNMPPGVNKCIGQYSDKVRNRIYLYIWNDLDHDTILYYDRNSDTIIKVLENLVDTDGDVLDFNPSKKILHIDIIYRDDEGDLIFWTDGNVSPRKINVQTILNGTYTTVKAAFIEVAKRPPLSPPTCVYGSDTSRKSNALRRKMFMATHRFVYDDFEKSSFSTFSKIPLPNGYYGSDNDLDNSFNNFITITVETGDENVTDIEIAVRQNIGNAWGDFLLVASINKAQYNIDNNSSYQFLFYNDALYPPITDGIQYFDGVQIIPLFDWIPQLADTQVMANGNIPTYAAITENYNNIPINELDVTLTAENVTNIPPDADPLAINYTFGGASWTFTVTGTVIEGTNIKIYIFFNGNPAIGQTYGVRLVAEYTTLPGDDINDVAFALYSDFNSYSSVPVITGGYGANIWTSNFGTSGSNVQSIMITTGSTAGTISTEKTWLWDANYVFGLVYVDEQNRDMPGVTTFANPTDSDNDFVVTTPSFSLDTTAVQTPVISASINHLPPDGAVSYYWVRRRQTYGTFMMYETCDFQEEDGFYYLCLGNIDLYKEENSQFIYGTAPITTDSRIKIIAGITNDAYDGAIWEQDYQVLGTVTRTVTGGSSPDDDRLFVKIKVPLSAPSPVYQENMLVMIYTPAINPTSAETSVYYEWGEKYDIYELDGVRYHSGENQDQTGSQPATFTWEEGDVYFHQRTMYKNIATATPYDTDTVSLMDANYSDFFDSAVNDNGRAQVIEVNAKQAFNPTLIRFGGAYQSGTSVNETNKFYFENFDEYDRSNGAIKKMFIEGRRLFVFQQFDVGVVPILTQIILDTAGNPLEANSEQLLNKITYPYIGKFGIGDIPESFAYGKGAMYFGDNNKGVYCRLSNQGVTPLSVLYSCHSFFIDKMKAYNNSLNNGNGATGQSYTGNPTVYATFNENINRVIICLEEINRYDGDGNLTFHQDPYTITFNEARDSTEGFESFMSYHPEMLGCLNNFMFMLKQGYFWKHEGGYFCNFFNYQYGVYIKQVFNDNVIVKKTYQAISEYGNTIWPCTEITTQMLNVSGTAQTSNLLLHDFNTLESNFHATFKGDTNYGSTKYNGKKLKGNYIIIKFEITQAPNFVFLNVATVRWINSPLTVAK